MLPGFCQQDLLLIGWGPKEVAAIVRPRKGFVPVAALKWTRAVASLMKWTYQPTVKQQTKVNSGRVLPKLINRNKGTWPRRAKVNLAEMRGQMQKDMEKEVAKELGRGSRKASSTAWSW